MMRGGVIRGEKLLDFARLYMQEKPIEDLDIPFAAVATDLENGREVWLREGSEFVKVVVTFMCYATKRLGSKSAPTFFSGLSQTSLSLCQFLVFPDQRFGFCFFANS